MGPSSVGDPRRTPSQRHKADLTDPENPKMSENTTHNRHLDSTPQELLIMFAAVAILAVDFAVMVLSSTTSTVRCYHYWHYDHLPRLLHDYH